MAGEPLDAWGSNSAEGGEQAEQATGTKTEADIRAEVEAELRGQLAGMLEGTEAYKALQRAMAKADREHKGALSTKDAELAAMREQLQSMQEGMTYLSGTLMTALPDEDRARVEADLRQKQIETLSRKVQQLDRRPQTAPVMQMSDEIEETIQRLQKETQESLEDVVREHGLDPKEKGLDFGADEDSFPARLKKLNASVKQVKKAKEDADVESVKPKVPLATTRTTGGADAGDGFGKDFLDRGAAEVWERMQRDSRKVKKVA